MTTTAGKPAKRHERDPVTAEVGLALAPGTADLCVTGQLVGAVDLGQGVLTASDDLVVARFRP